MTAPNIPELRRLLAEATPGPWHWSGNERSGPYLATWGSEGLGRCVVMAFKRLGMQSAQPVFVTGGLIQERCPTVREVPYRDDIIDIDHPDARAIVALRNDVPALLDLLDAVCLDLHNAHENGYGSGTTADALARYRAMCGEP